jgi:hypothetical protein
MNPERGGETDLTKYSRTRAVFASRLAKVKVRQQTRPPMKVSRFVWGGTECLRLQDFKRKVI